MAVAYNGNEPYIFVSYSHKDGPAVLRIVEALNDNGFRVWYDNGIEAGTEWPEYIAERLMSSQVVIAFMSRNSQESHNCRREIHFAIELKKELLVVYLEDFELSPGMRLQLSALQAMYRAKCSDDADFCARLCNAAILQKCKTPDSAPKPADPVAEVKTAEVKTAEVKTAEVKTAEVKTAEVKTAEVKTAEAKTAEAKTAEVKTAEVKTAEVKTAEVAKLAAVLGTAAALQMRKNSGSAPKPSDPVAEVKKPVAVDPVAALRTAVRVANENKEVRKSFYFQFAKDVSQKQLANAVKAIAKNKIEQSEIIAIMDDTLSENGKSGFVVTKKQFFSGGTGFLSTNFDFPLEGLKWVSMPKNDHLALTYEDGRGVDQFFSIYTRYFLLFFQTYIAETHKTGDG